MWSFRMTVGDRCYGMRCMPLVYNLCSHWEQIYSHRRTNFIKVFLFNLFSSIYMWSFRMTVRHCRPLFLLFCFQNCLFNLPRYICSHWRKNIVKSYSNLFFCSHQRTNFISIKSVLSKIYSTTKISSHRTVPWVKEIPIIKIIK